MTFDADQLRQAAARDGFQPDLYEKVLRLTELLSGLGHHPYLGDRLVLKGGTALNLFVLGLPRLSVDIDLNYVGALDREAMLAERPLVEQAIQAVCSRLDLRVQRVPDEHAGGKWRLTYRCVTGGTGTLELDLNYLLRVPLWPVVRHDSPELVGISARRVPLLDIHELVAGKLAALFSRSASRDLYDVAEIAERLDLMTEKMRLAFVLYGAMSRRDWRTVSMTDIAMDPAEARVSLLPLLRCGVDFDDPGEIACWCDDIVARCCGLVAGLLPLASEEREFLDRLNDYGEIKADLLTSDPQLQERIRRHPALRWKALNVRRYRGL